MKVNDFKISFENLKNGGKEYFEEYLQWCGWWFMHLSEKQCIIVFDYLDSLGYEHTTDRFDRDCLKFPNGMMFTKYNL